MKKRRLIEEHRQTHILRKSTHALRVVIEAQQVIHLGHLAGGRLLLLLLWQRRWRRLLFQLGLCAVEDGRGCGGCAGSNASRPD